jgi:hypothetical protein
MAYNNYYGNPYYQQPNFYNNNGATPDMFNQIKGQYQQPMMQQPMAQPMPTQTQPDPMLWVLSQTEAESYPVAPNNVVTLWDKNTPTIYIKSANAQGVPSIRILDFTERTANTPKTPEKHECQCGNKFILKEELNAAEVKIQEVMCRLSDLEEKYNSLSAKSTPKTTKKTEE